VVSFFIRRPVFASVCSLIIVLVGWIGYGRLPVQEFPSIDPPVVTVRTTYSGANPGLVETEITEVLESEINGIEGIETLTSQSLQSSSQITVRFLLDRDIDVAAQDVRDRVGRALQRLPEEADPPVVSKESGDASPILWFALSGGDRLTSLELNNYVERYVIDPLETVSGVSRIFVGGERRYAMRIWLDPTQLAARNLTVLDIEDVLRRENVEIPSGLVEGETAEYSVRTLGRLRSPTEYEALVLRSDAEGNRVTLGDVGRVELGAENERTFARFKGDEAVALGVVKLAKSNTVAVAAAAKAEMERLSQDFPEGMTYAIAFDESAFVERAISEVWQALFGALVLVVLVIFGFLHDWRATLVPAIAMPVSLVGAFAVMSGFGFSINTLTLFALTLATGLVVDDAIVVLENIVRLLQTTDMSPAEAAEEGTQEVIFAVIATTLVLVAVFVPVGLSSGTTGRLFAEFAFTLAGSVVISTVVALTLTPMLAARLLRSRSGRRRSLSARLMAGVDVLLNHARDTYARLLRGIIRWRVVAVGVFGATLAISYGLYLSLPQEFLPSEDRGGLLVFVNAPEGSSLPYNDRVMRQVETVLAETPGIESYFTIGAFGRGGGEGQTNRGIAFAKLVGWDERSQADQTQGAILGQLQQRLGGITEALVFPIALPGLPGAGFEPPIQFVLQATDLETLVNTSNTFLERARQLPELINADTDLKVNKPELTIQIDRDRAAALGVPVEDVATTLQILLGGQTLSNFIEGNRRYDVIAQAEAEFRASPSAIEALYIRTGDGQIIPLSALVQVNTTTTPPQIPHFNRFRSSTLSASPAPGSSLGQALDALNALAQEVLPEDMRTALNGESLEFVKTGRSALVTFLLGLAFIYLVLAAQFESFVDPLVVMLAVPLSLLGAFGTLLLMGQTFNAYSQVGAIVLIGLVTKNSILLVEFANQLRDRGLPPVKAAIESGRLRFRPILMTAFSTIFGLLPLALSSGPGAASRVALSLAVVGGMTVSTFLTLGIVPAFYTLVNGSKRPISR
jgi:HAE1 family hydrophobic/amphiphilic exporter-1/multidrug efflux pump